MVLSLEPPTFLDFDNLPDTNFTCVGKVIGGYYADLETNCQMFHVCTIGQLDEPMDIRFLCLNGTVFDQETRVCERIDEVDCTKSEQFYSLNLELYGNTQPAILEETPETDPPLIHSTAPPTTTTTSTTQRPKPKPTPPPSYYTTAQPTITTTHRKVLSPHHFPNANSADIRFNPEEINISLNPGSLPNIRTKPFQSYSDNRNNNNNNNNNNDNNNNNKHVLTSSLNYQDEDESVSSEDVKRPQILPVERPKSNLQITYGVPNNGHNQNNNYDPQSVTPADINHGFTYIQKQKEYSPQIHQQKDYSPQIYQQKDYIPENHQQKEYSPQHQPHNYHYQSNIAHFRPSFLDHHRNNQATTLRNYPHSTQKITRYHIPNKPTTLRNHYLQSLKPPPPPQNYHNYNQQPRTEAPQRLQLSLPFLPTISPLTFSSPAPFSLPRHIETKRYTKDHQAPPRIIISASASVSDATGKRLNYSLGEIGAAHILEQPPSSYDEYKEDDVGLDPFYHDVPKLKRRSKRQINHSEVIKNEKEAVDVLKFLFDWYKNHQQSTTLTIPVAPSVITEINEELGVTANSLSYNEDLVEHPVETVEHPVDTVEITPKSISTNISNGRRGRSRGRGRVTFTNSELFNGKSKFNIVGGAIDYEDSKPMENREDRNYRPKSIDYEDYQRENRQNSRRVENKGTENRGDRNYRPESIDYEEHYKDRQNSRRVDNKAVGHREDKNYRTESIDDEQYQKEDKKNNRRTENKGVEARGGNRFRPESIDYIYQGDTEHQEKKIGENTGKNPSESKVENTYQQKNIDYDYQAEIQQQNTKSEKKSQEKSIGQNIQETEINNYRQKNVDYDYLENTKHQNTGNENNQENTVKKDYGKNNQEADNKPLDIKEHGLEQRSEDYDYHQIHHENTNNKDVENKNGNLESENQKDYITNIENKQEKQNEPKLVDNLEFEKEIRNLKYENTKNIEPKNSKEEEEQLKFVDYEDYPIQEGPTDTENIEDKENTKNIDEDDKNKPVKAEEKDIKIVDYEELPKENTQKEYQNENINNKNEKIDKENAEYEKPKNVDEADKNKTLEQTKIKDYEEYPKQVTQIPFEEEKIKNIDELSKNKPLEGQVEYTEENSQKEYQNENLKHKENENIQNNYESSKNEPLKSQDQHFKGVDYKNYPNEANVNTNNENIKTVNSKDEAHQNEEANNKHENLKTNESVNNAPKEQIIYTYSYFDYMDDNYEPKTYKEQKPQEIPENVKINTNSNQKESSSFKKQYPDYENDNYEPLAYKEPITDKIKENQQLNKEKYNVQNTSNKKSYEEKNKYYEHVETSTEPGVTGEKLTETKDLDENQFKDQETINNKSLYATINKTLSSSIKEPYTEINVIAHIANRDENYKNDKTKKKFSLTEKTYPADVEDPYVKNVTETSILVEKSTEINENLPVADLEQNKSVRTTENLNSFVQENKVSNLPNLLETNIANETVQTFLEPKTRPIYTTTTQKPRRNNRRRGKVRFSQQIEQHHNTITPNLEATPPTVIEAQDLDVTSFSPVTEIVTNQNGQVLVTEQTRYETTTENGIMETITPYSTTVGTEIYSTTEGTTVELPLTEDTTYLEKISTIPTTLIQYSTTFIPLKEFADNLKTTTESEDKTTVFVDQTTGFVDKTTSFTDKTTGYVDKTTGFVDKTADFVDKTNDFIDKTGFVDKTTGYADKTTGFVDKTTGFVDKTTDFVDKTTGFADKENGFVDKTGLIDKTTGFVEKTTDTSNKITDIHDNTTTTNVETTNNVDNTTPNSISVPETSSLSTTTENVSTTTTVPSRSSRRGYRGRNNNNKRFGNRHRFSTDYYTQKPTTRVMSRVTKIPEDIPMSTDAPLYKSAKPTQQGFTPNHFKTTPTHPEKLDYGKSRPQTLNNFETTPTHAEKIGYVKSHPQTLSNFRTTPTPTLTHTKMMKNYVFNCFDREINRFYADPRDCRLFHYCTQGFNKNQLLDMKFVCDSSTYFDDEKLICSKTKPARCL